MWKRISRSIESVLEDFGYFAKRVSALMFGKQGAELLAAYMGPLAGASIAYIAGFGESAAGATLEAAVGMTLAVGAVAGVSAGLVQSDFLHRRHMLKERYKKEIGAIVGKSPEKVTEADMEKVARGSFQENIQPNPTLHEEIHNTRLERNIGGVLSVIAAAATFLILHSDAVHGALSQVVDTIAPGAGTAAMVATKLAVNGVAGLITYYGIKTPAHWLAAAVTELELETTNDRVTDIKRALASGHHISPEKVLEVFINAHPEVAEQLEAEYGRSYENLNHMHKRAILEEVQQSIDILRLTEDINHGRVRPEELAFTAFGQESGLAPAGEGSIQQHSTNVLHGMWHSLKSLTGNYQHPAKAADTQELAANLPMPGTTQFEIHTPDANTASLALNNYYEEPGRKQNFVARIGRKVSDEGLTHVERLEQSTSQETILTR